MVDFWVNFRNRMLQMLHKCYKICYTMIDPLYFNNNKVVTFVTFEKGDSMENIFYWKSEKVNVTNVTGHF